MASEQRRLKGLAQVIGFFLGAVSCMIVITMPRKTYCRVGTSTSHRRKSPAFRPEKTLNRCFET
jgi:hypothetical protein